MGTNVLELFCGAGGFTLGLQNAGFDVIAGVDYDESAIETYRTNFDHAAIEENLASVPPEQFADKWGFGPSDVDVVAGGPPCQGVSTANAYRDVEDERNDLLFVFADYVDFYQPRAFLMENVEGLLSIDDGDLFASLLQRFESMGYETGWRKLNAANFGIPQERERVFVQGHADGEPSWPTRTHYPPTEVV